MNKLQELFDSELELITEKSQLPSWALGMLKYNFARGSKQNLNNRIYPDELLARVIGKKSEQLKSQKIAGQLEHPSMGIYTRLDKVAHILADVSYDRDTKLASAKSYILATARGKDFLTILKSGLKVGASMRGLGDVKNGYVQDGYAFDTVDFVLKPSFGADAAIDSSNLIESANDLLDEPKEKKGISERFVQKILEISYDSDIEQGRFVGGFEDWKKQKEPFYRAEIFVQEGIYESREEALKAMGVTEKMPMEEEGNPFELGDLMSNFNEAVQAGYRGTVQEFKEKFIIKPRELEKVNEKSGLTLEQRQDLFSEANMAGVDMSVPGNRERYFKNAKALRDERQPTEDELAEAEAQRVGVTKETVLGKWAIDKEQKIKEAKRQRIISQVNRDFQLSGATSKFVTLEQLVFKELDHAGLLTPQEKNWKVFRDLLAESKTK